MLERQPTNGTMNLPSQQLQTRVTVVTDICSSNNFITMYLSPWIINKQGGNHDFPVTTCDKHMSSQNLVNMNIRSMFSPVT